MASTIDLGLVKGPQGPTGARGVTGPTGPKGDTGRYNPGKTSIGSYEYNGFTVQYHYTYYTNFCIEIIIRIDTTVGKVKLGTSGISLGTIPVSYAYPNPNCYLYGLATPFTLSDIKYNCFGKVDSSNRLTLYSTVRQDYQDDESVVFALRCNAPANTYTG